MLKKFIKYQSLGNDFILLDFYKKTQTQINKIILDSKWKNFVINSCDRHFGIGADGILIISKKEILIFNSDGSQAEICLNGLRCATDFLYKNYKFPIQFNLIMGGKIIECEINKINSKIEIINKINVSSEIEEKTIEINQKKIKGHYLQIPNPHFIIQKKITSKDLLNWGQLIENYPEFKNKTNVEFIHKKDSSINSIDLLVHERGCGPTLACSSGATAVLYFLFKTKQIKLNQKIKINMPGGTLVCWIDKNGKINLQAQAQLIFNGNLT